MNIWIAAADNNLQKVESYLASGNFTANSKDQNGYTPVHAAAEYGHLDLIQRLIEKGADLNIQDNDGDTPLHACEQPRVAEFLVRLGADLSTKNHDGLTPLQKAEEDADFPELIAYLRKVCGINIPEEDSIPENIQMSFQSEDPETIPSNVTDEQRAKLAEIVDHGTDADFEAYLKEALGSNESEDAAKKAKRDSE